MRLDPRELGQRCDKNRVARLIRESGLRALWWTREVLGPWLPALSVDDPRLVRFLKQAGWIDGS